MPTFLLYGDGGLFRQGQIIFLPFNQPTFENINFGKADTAQQASRRAREGAHLINEQHWTRLINLPQNGLNLVARDVLGVRNITLLEFFGFAKVDDLCIFAINQRCSISWRHRWARALLREALEDQAASRNDDDANQKDVIDQKLLHVDSSFVKEIGVRPKRIRRDQPPCNSMSVLNCRRELYLKTPLI